MMCSAMAPKARVAAGPRCSRGSASRASGRSFSAAADLVVKPATPPNRIPGSVGNASVAACSVAYGCKADMSSDIAGTATALASSPKTDSTKVRAVQTKQEGAVPEEVAAEKPGRQALVEVRGLSGESFVKANFQLSDRVLSVKDRVLTTRSIPLWQQMLSFQGEMLHDQSTLGELKLLEGTVFDLVLKSGPLPEDMEALADVARATLTDGIKGMETLTKLDIMEVKAMAKPPRVCEEVCLAALHLLAGLATEIPIKCDGSPKKADWSVCKLMMRDTASFRKQILELPSYIDQGRVRADRVAKCRQVIDTIEGDSESEKIQYAARASRMCQQLVTFLIGVVKYYDSVAEFRERFGGATIMELISHQ